MQLTIQQAAELLHASEAQVRKWIRDRGLPAVLFNEQYHLNRLDLVVWAHLNQVPVPEQAIAPQVVPDVALANALTRGGIHRDLPGGSRDQLVRAAVERLRLPDRVDRELLFEMINARELRGSTAIGDGIAIPHARYPIVTAVPVPLLGLGFARTAVDFGAPDGLPVFAVFVLVTPTNHAHLTMLARLAGALSAELLAPVRNRAEDAVIFAAALASDARVTEAARVVPP